MKALLVFFISFKAILAGSLFRGYNYNYYGGGDMYRPDDDDDGRVWTFMIGSDYGPYEYIDENGYMKGFHPDLIKAVCAKAGKSCYWMIDTYQHCWNTEGGQYLPGLGLMGGWYDGCVGPSPTPERMNSFNFSKPWTKQELSALFFRKDDRRKFEASNLAGQNIGIMNGWASGRTCLGRQPLLRNSQPEDYNAVYFDTVGELVKAVQKKQVDGVVLAADFDAASNGLVQRGPIISCTVAGASVMTRYGSPVLGWWNEAFDAMVESGEFRDLCKLARRIHGSRGNIDCFLD